MADKNVQIDEQEVQKVLKLIQQASVGTITESTKVDWKKLQQAAKDFLFAYNSLDKNEEFYTQEALRQMVLAAPESIPYLNKISGVKQAFLIRSKYLLAIQFDEYLNQFRGALPSSVIYVQSSSDGTISGSYEISMRELILNADKYGRINISNARLKSGERESLEESGSLIDEKHVQEAQMAYSGSINRLQRFYDVAHKSGNAAQGGIILWREGKEWIHGRVTNKGDIKEAYIGFLMSDHVNKLCKLAGGQPPYYSHELIGNFFDMYIANVTNLAAIVEEDIATKSKQYGIKSRKAQLPSLGQYLDAAEWIVSQENLLTKQEVENWIRNEKFTQDTIRNMRLSMEKLGEKYSEDIIKSLQSSMKKT